MLKKISSDARKDCERFMGTKVFLQTWVRVKENWRDSDFMISNFGYHKLTKTTGAPQKSGACCLLIGRIIRRRGG